MLFLQYAVYEGKCEKTEIKYNKILYTESSATGLLYGKEACFNGTLNCYCYAV